MAHYYHVPVAPRIRAELHTRDVETIDRDYDFDWYQLDEDGPEYFERELLPPTSWTAQVMAWAVS